MVNGLDADKMNNGTQMHDDRDSPKIDLVEQWHQAPCYPKRNEIAFTNAVHTYSSQSQLLSANQISATVDKDSSAEKPKPTNQVAMTVPQTSREVNAVLA